MTGYPPGYMDDPYPIAKESALEETKNINPNPVAANTNVA